MLSDENLSLHGTLAPFIDTSSLSPTDQTCVIQCQESLSRGLNSGGGQGTKFALLFLDCLSHPFMNIGDQSIHIRAR